MSAMHHHQPQCGSGTGGNVLCGLEGTAHQRGHRSNPLGPRVVGVLRPLHTVDDDPLVGERVGGLACTGSSRGCARSLRGTFSEARVPGPRLLVLLSGALVPVRFSLAQANMFAPVLARSTKSTLRHGTAMGRTSAPFLNAGDQAGAGLGLDRVYLPGDRNASRNVTLGIPAGRAGAAPGGPGTGVARRRVDEGWIPCRAGNKASPHMRRTSACRDRGKQPAPWKSKTEAAARR